MEAGEIPTCADSRRRVADCQQRADDLLSRVPRSSVRSGGHQGRRVERIMRMRRISGSLRWEFGLLV